MTTITSTSLQINMSPGRSTYSQFMCLNRIEHSLKALEDLFVSVSIAGLLKSQKCGDFHTVIAVELNFETCVHIDIRGWDWALIHMRLGFPVPA